MVRDGQTVVLGGLFREETEIVRNQVPGLGDIPLIGNAFKGRDDTVERDEVIFLITPHVVKDEAIERAGKSVRDSMEMIRVGAREGLLPWSRSKMTAAHLRDALRYIEANDRDMALWEVDLALGLNSSHTEALRLKEKLAGHRTYYPHRSLLDEAVNLMVEEQTGERRQQQRMRPMKPSPRPTIPNSDTEPPISVTPAATGPVATTAQVTNLDVVEVTGTELPVAADTVAVPDTVAADAPAAMEAIEADVAIVEESDDGLVVELGDESATPRCGSSRRSGDDRRGRRGNRRHHRIQFRC